MEMTIEERLERLTERHEALSQTVELMAHHQEEAFAKHEVWMEKNQVLMAQVLESIGSLARIARVHEQRITDLEDRRQ